MRKLLMVVLVGLLLICSGLLFVKGFEKINIKGINAIKEKDAEIENKISELSNEVSTLYPKAEGELKSASDNFVNKKTEYENQVVLSSSNGSSYISTLEPYDIDYLWTRLGNYAKDENVVIKMDLTAGGSSRLYNLNFTVVGTYVGTTDFIYDIENDSVLGFKIDDFKMTAGGNTEVTASFICKDIPISVGNIETTDATTTRAKNNTTGDNTQNTDTTNTNATNANTTNANTTNANTTNATNTTNTTEASNSSGNTNTSASQGSNAAAEYGVSDPNKSNLTSIDQVVDR